MRCAPCPSGPRSPDPRLELRSDPAPVHDGRVTRAQRVVVIGVGAAVCAPASASVARRVGAPGEAVVPASLLGAAFGALFASRVLAALDRFRTLGDGVPGAGRGSVEPGAGPPPPAGGPEEVEGWLAAREDLTLFAPDGVAALPAALEPGERVTGVGLGTRDGVGGLLAVTDRRILFLRKAGGVDAFVLGSIVSATVREGPVLGALTVEHAGGEATFEVAAPALAHLAAGLGVPLRRAADPAPRAPAEPPAPSTEGPGDGA